MPRSSIPVAVPPIVRAKAVAASGDDGWVRDLPGLIGELERDWSMTVVEVLPGGTASVVARVVLDDGGPAVVKVAVPDSGFGEQLAALTRADGDGYVRVLRHHPSHDAVLLEALGTALPAAGLSPTEQLRVLARLLSRIWRAPTSGAGEPRDEHAEPRDEHAEPRDKAAELAALVDRLWRETEPTVDDEVRRTALSCADRRSAAVDPAACVMVHGDAATANAARVLESREGTEDGFVLLDPEPFLGDPAYDLGVAVRDRTHEVLAAGDPVSLLDGWCRTVAEPPGLDPVAVWDWGYLERVSTGLYALSLGAHQVGADHLRSAEVLLG